MVGAAQFDFSGKVVAVVGGGTGIGAGVASAFANAGANVCVGGRRIEPLKRFCERHRGQADFVQMDVTSEDDRCRTIDTLIERHGRLDVLINSTLAVYAQPFGDLNAKRIARMYDVLLAGPTALMQAALPHLVRSKGCMIGISSVAGRHVPFPSTGMAVYAAAKAGLNQLVRGLSSEVGALGVRVNAIAPGPTRTETAPLAATERLEAAIKFTPMARLGEPSDIAPVALFLASDAAAWVTGQVIDVAGGFGLSG